MQQELKRLRIILGHLKHTRLFLLEAIAESDLEEARIGGLEDFFMDEKLGGRRTSEEFHDATSQELSTVVIHLVSRQYVLMILLQRWKGPFTHGAVQLTSLD